MTDTTSTATSSLTPDEEMKELIAKVAALSKLSLEMTSRCIDITGKLFFLSTLFLPLYLTFNATADSIPRVIGAKVAAKEAELTGKFFHIVLAIAHISLSLSSECPRLLPH